MLIASNKAYIADEDVRCYKRFRIVGIDVNGVIELATLSGQLVRVCDELIADRSVSVESVNNGGFFVDGVIDCYIDNCNSLYKCSSGIMNEGLNSIMLECLIPAGEEFYYNIEYNGIAAHRIYITNNIMPSKFRVFSSCDCGSILSYLQSVGCREVDAPHQLKIPFEKY